MTQSLPRFYSFWSIDGQSNSEALQRHVDQLHKAGFDGIVAECNELNAEALARLSGAILYAKSLGLRFWIADKSSNTSPITTEDAGLRLILTAEPQADALISCRIYENDSDATGQKWYIKAVPSKGIDTMRPDPGLTLLDFIQERYRQGLAPEAFEYLEAFFAGAPGRDQSLDRGTASVPWSDKALDYLQEQFGEQAEAQLPFLFFPGSGSDEFRTSFWEFASDATGSGFFDPYQEWCKKWGKMFVGMIRNEGPLPLVSLSTQLKKGSLLSGTNAPGRFLPFFVRYAASVAAQFGDGRSVAECGGVEGWGTTQEDFERSLTWLARNGATDIVLYPGVYDRHLEALQNVRRSLEEKPLGAPTTLVIAPLRGMMAMHDPRETGVSSVCRHLNEKLERLRAQGTVFHVCDEQTWQTYGAISSKGIQLGQCVYMDVVISSDALLTRKGMQILEGINQRPVTAPA